MNIKNFFEKYNNHPVLFLGTGISLRYHHQSYTWDGLLSKIAFDISGKEEYYLDLKSNSYENGVYSYAKIATAIEKYFEESLREDRNGKFKEINDIFYDNVKKGINTSRFKIYIASLFSNLTLDSNKNTELDELKQACRNIGSIITTNYDTLIEDKLNFRPLIGNEILLSEPYGSVYKIHGCVTNPNKIIITAEDYNDFYNKYDLINAQLLSLFIHHPIIFMGYSIGDDDIKRLLKTIFSFVEPNSMIASKIKENFLLVEYEKGSTNTEITEYNIMIDAINTIQINRLKTDDFLSIYQEIKNLHLPISAMDVRKVQSVVKDIYSGGSIKVTIASDLDTLDNNKKILAIGSLETIYIDITLKELLLDYFNIIDSDNYAKTNAINGFIIQSTQYFPIFAFSKKNSTIKKVEKFKKNQETNLKHSIERIYLKNKIICDKNHNSIYSIINDPSIPISYKNDIILWGVYNDNISLEDTENYLRNFDRPYSTDFNKILCAYDYKKYKD